MDDLVKSISVSRHGIYTAFGGKKQLLLACFDRYQETVVSPAFHVVETPNADFGDVADYFEYQISGAETAGLPGPGCFVANSMTELAPADREVRAKVDLHNRRLFQGFESAIGNEIAGGHHVGQKEMATMAATFVIFTNGLWSMSRTANDAGQLRTAVALFLETMAARLKPPQGQFP